MNVDGAQVASKDSSRPWTLWIWDILSPQPLAVVDFRDRIKQLLWHPTAPEILLILTIQKEPLVYVWHTTKEQLLILEGLTLNGDAGPGDYEAKWLACTNELTLLFLTSPHQYDAGTIDIGGDNVNFQSVLRQANPGA